MRMHTYGAAALIGITRLTLAPCPLCCLMAWLRCSVPLPPWRHGPVSHIAALAHRAHTFGSAHCRRSHDGLPLLLGQAGRLGAFNPVRYLPTHPVISNGQIETNQLVFVR